MNSQSFKERKCVPVGQTSPRVTNFKSINFGVLKKKKKALNA